MLQFKKSNKLNCMISERCHEVSTQYFQQAVLLCLVKALYYAGICSNATYIILCPKLCWYNSLRPNENRMNDDLGPPPPLVHYVTSLSSMSMRLLEWGRVGGVICSWVKYFRVQSSRWTSATKAELHAQL